VASRNDSAEKGICSPEMVAERCIWIVSGVVRGVAGVVILRIRRVGDRDGVGVLGVLGGIPNRRKDSAICLCCCFVSGKGEREIKTYRG